MRSNRTFAIVATSPVLEAAKKSSCRGFGFAYWWSRSSPDLEHRRGLQGCFLLRPNIRTTRIDGSAWTTCRHYVGRDFGGNGLKSLLDYVHKHEIGETVTLTPHNLDATDEVFHDSVSSFVDAGGGPGFVVTVPESESFSGYRRRDGGFGRYFCVTCERVA